MFSLMEDFKNVRSEFEAYFILCAVLLTGIVIGGAIVILFSNKRDTYFHGQIDAIRGIIKWKLEQNEDGENVWTEIK